MTAPYDALTQAIRAQALDVIAGTSAERDHAVASIVWAVGAHAGDDTIAALIADAKPKPCPVAFRHPDGSGTDLHPLIGVLAALLEDDDREYRRRQREAVRDRQRARFAPRDSPELDPGSRSEGEARCA